ncbi:hypothetical protein GUITHDRAFT_68705, partial [Guillardia theta CCMP2712]
RYRLGGCVGEGATGKVYVGLNVSTGDLLAVKQIHFDNITRDELAAIEQEILLLQKLRHDHVVSYIAIDITDTNLNILMEFCPGGSVAHLLKAFGALEEEVLRAYTRQIIEGLDFLHQNQVVHRDIKAAFPLLCLSPLFLKIADFGATMVLTGNKTMTEDGKQIQGTPYWHAFVHAQGPMAPEVIKQEAYGRKADVWSLGMTVLEMATAKHPWEKFNNKFAAMTEIASGSSLPDVPSHLSPSCKDFILCCIQR